MKKKILYILILFLLVIVLTPYKTVSVPEWKLRVIRPDGQPVPEIEVIQDWSDYEILGEKRDIRVSDTEGFVTFSEKTFWSPLAFRTVLYFLDSIKAVAMPHGTGKGSSATVWTKKVDSLWLFYKQGDELKDTLQLKK